MAQYNYFCGQCKRLFATNDRADATICPDCKGKATRRFSFYTSGGIKEHWNAAVGQYVSNQHEMSEALKRRGEEASLRTGLDTQYEYVDPADMKDAAAHGANEDVLEPSRQRLHDLSQ